MALTLPHPSMFGGFSPTAGNVKQFYPTTVHSDATHNDPHSQLLENDIAVKTWIDARAWLNPITVGSGSGLDADLLDGHHWTEVVTFVVVSPTTAYLDSRGDTVGTSYTVMQGGAPLGYVGIGPAACGCTCVCTCPCPCTCTSPCDCWN